MPAFISEPHSFIETTASLFTHISFFREALNTTDPVDRLALLTRFYISGFHIRPRGVKKPYNPILGEVFRCFWDHDDGSRTWYVSEQVSHHPPISAFYFENLDTGYTIEGQIQIKANYTGNSAGTFMIGTIFVHLLKFRETYTITYPVYYARGVVFGTMRLETVGKTRIACAQTGLESIVDFKAKPTFGGKYNQVEANIYRMPEQARPMAPILPTPAANPPSFQPAPDGLAAQIENRKRSNPLIHIWGDWTNVLYATDLRKPASLKTPYTPEMLQEAAEIQWKVSHNMTPYQSASETEKLPPLVPAQVPAGSPPNTVVFFDVHCSPFISKRCLAPAAQKPFESRVVWAQLTKNMLAKDYDEARNAKNEVEERQREILRQRKATRTGFRQRFFFFDPVPRTPEEAIAYPHGRYRLNYHIDSNSSQQEIDPARRLFTCYNLPDMHELIETAPPLTDELLKKDEDNITTDFLSIKEAAQVLRDRKAKAEKSEGASSSSSSSTDSSTSSLKSTPTPEEIDALIAEGVFGPRWPMGDPPIEAKRKSAKTSQPAPAQAAPEKEEVPDGVEYL